MVLITFTYLETEMNTVLSVNKPLALSFTYKLSFSFFFYQSTALSSHAVDGHQMYF